VDSSSAGISLSADERFVDHLYRTYLGRSGSLAELDPWVRVLPASGTSGVARQIAYSAEACARRITTSYEQILHRPAESNAIAFWTVQLQHGLPAESLAAGLLGSAEYYALAGGSPGTGTSDARFIQGLYSQVLGRMASDSEVNSLLGALPAVGRQPMAQAFLKSPEYRASSVRGYYSQLLSRTGSPSDGEIAGWVNSPLGLLDIELGFASTPEFYARS
jgi:hypothetical protein